MKTGTWNQKLSDYYNLAANQFDPIREAAKVSCEKAWSRVSSLLFDYILSEVCIFKIMLLSFGVLIGATFSDFFKKHRVLVLAVVIGSAALFLYRAYQMLEELEEQTEF